MYPPQQPNDPNSGGQNPYQGGHDPYQGGHDPYQGAQNPYQGANPYQQGPPGYPGVPEQASGKMPGTAITVRVLMFIGGVVGLLFGGCLLLVAVMAGGDNEFSRGFAEGVQEAGTYVDPTEIAIVMAVMGGIMFLYGLVSTALASFMGRRSAVVLWLIVVFQGLAALSLVLGVVTGGPLGIIPLFFAIGMIVLMVIPATRAYYTPQPANPYTGY